MNVVNVILSVLFNARGVSINEPVLLTEVRVQVKGCGETSFKNALGNLAHLDYVECEVDDLTLDHRWKITEKGITRVREGK